MMTRPMSSLLMGLLLLSCPGSFICRVMALGHPPNRCPMHPKKYSRRLKRLSLGMPPCIRFSINNHQFILLHTIFFSLHALCAMLGAYFFYFLVCFIFLDVHNKL